MSNRQIVLDTETTGLDPEQGHRIIEIGCVELIDRKRTHNDYRQFINPEREIDAGALEVHGITLESLQDKPKFIDIVEELLAYLKGAELIIHNAPFDIGFLDYELKLIGEELGNTERYCSVLDTLVMARQNHPGQRNDLDALCRRYEVDNSQRTVHGALLDAEILAEVYLLMTGGQTAFLLDGVDDSGVVQQANETIATTKSIENLIVQPANNEELELHNTWLEKLQKDSEGSCVWYRLNNTD